MPEEYVTSQDFETYKFNIAKIIKAKWNKAQVMAQSLSGTLTLKVHDRRVQFLDPNGANRDVTLPPEADSVDSYFIFFNTADAHEKLVIKNDGGSTIITIWEDDLGGIVFCDGTDWKGLVGGTRLHTNTETLSANKTLTETDEKVHFFDPDGQDRDVVLPPEATSDGLHFYIFNTADAGGEDLVVKDDGAGTIITISQNEGGVVFCNGVVWKGFLGGIT